MKPDKKGASMTEKTLERLTILVSWISWIMNIAIAYSAAHSLIPDFGKCLPLAYIFYWLLETGDEIKLKHRK